MDTRRMHAKFPQKNVQKNITEKLGTDSKIILGLVHTCNVTAYRNTVS